eukprot:6208558-Pleurochrysis_carterae.AAC.4
MHATIRYFAQDLFFRELSSAPVLRLIISLEMHCSLSQQDKIVTLARRILGTRACESRGRTAAGECAA